jgi:hypothetical protein
MYTQVYKFKINAEIVTVLQNSCLPLTFAKTHCTFNVLDFECKRNSQTTLTKRGDYKSEY